MLTLEKLREECKANEGEIKFIRMNANTVALLLDVVEAAKLVSKYNRLKPQDCGYSSIMALDVTLKVLEESDGT